MITSLESESMPIASPHFIDIHYRWRDHMLLTMLLILIRLWLYLLTY